MGRIDGTRAFIALSVAGDRVRVYVATERRTRRAAVSQWFKGRWDGRSPFTLRAGGHVLRIESAHADDFDGKRPRAAGDRRGRPLRATRQPLRGAWIARDERRVRGAFVPTRPPKRCFPVQLADGRPSSSAAERLSVGARRDVQPRRELGAQCRRGGVARAAGDDRDRIVGALEQPLGEPEALLREPLARRGADVAGEEPA